MSQPSSLPRVAPNKATLKTTIQKIETSEYRARWTAVEPPEEEKAGDRRVDRLEGLRVFLRTNEDIPRGPGGPKKAGDWRVDRLEGCIPSSCCAKCHTKLGHGSAFKTQICETILFIYEYIL